MKEKTIITLASWCVAENLDTPRICSLRQVLWEEYKIDVNKFDWYITQMKKEMKKCQINRRR